MKKCWRMRGGTAERWYVRPVNKKVSVLQIVNATVVECAGREDTLNSKKMISTTPYDQSVVASWFVGIVAIRGKCCKHNYKQH